jgi:hypothetical protein
LRSYLLIGFLLFGSLRQAAILVSKFIAADTGKRIKI